MKKVYLFMVSCGLAATIANAQATFQWGKAEGKWAYDYGYGIKTDNDGNVYVVGKYEEVGAAFSGSTVNCEGNHDAFLAKYNAAGDLQWVQTMGGPDGDYSWAISTDKSSYLVVSGEIENKFHNSPNTISFSNSTITLASQGDNDAFLAKYDLDGNLLWAIDEGHGVNSEKGLGNAIDANGNIYMCGYFTNATVFNGTTYTGAGGRDIFVAKYNANGEFQWFRHAGSAGRDEAKAAVCDANGNVYICGGFDDGCVFDGTTLNTWNNSDYWDAFIAKYDTNGDLQWVRRGGGDVDDMAWSITIDNAGNLYTGGEMGAWAKFSTSQDDNNVFAIQAAGGADSYIAKYDQNGEIIWIRRGGSDKVDRIRGIGTDGTNIFATGQYSGTATFGNNSVVSVDTSDIFITVISPEGNWGFVETVGGSVDAVELLGYESGNAVTGTASGEVYATGGLLNGGTFGTHSVSGYSRTDAFVTKLTWSGTVGLKDQTQYAAVKMYPNPATGLVQLDLSEIRSDKVEVFIYNNLGQKVCAQQCSGTSASIDLSDYSEGIYFLQMESGTGKSAAQKLIISR